MSNKPDLTSHTTARYDTVEEAVTAAAGIFNPFSIESDREIGGGIVQDKQGKFYFTYTLGDPGKGAVKMRIRKPKSHNLVGIWHSHGKHNTGRSFFSKGDVKSARKLGVDSFMVDGEGTVRMLSKDNNGMQRFKDGKGSAVRRTGNPGVELQKRVRTKRADPIVLDKDEVSG